MCACLSSLLPPVRTSNFESNRRADPAPSRMRHTTPYELPLNHNVASCHRQTASIWASPTGLVPNGIRFDNYRRYAHQAHPVPGESLSPTRSCQTLDPPRQAWWGTADASCQTLDPPRQAWWGTADASCQTLDPPRQAWWGTADASCQTLDPPRQARWGNERGSCQTRIGRHQVGGVRFG